MNSHGAVNQLPLYQTETKDSEDNWDFVKSDTQYMTHGLHPYLASMIPQIPRKLLSMYASPRTKIFDPFAGGGAVIVESYLANLEAVGIDINPLAIILSKAKTSPIPKKALWDCLERFNQLICQSQAQAPEFPKSARIDFWFKANTIESLAQIRAVLDRLISQTDDECREKVKNFLACVFSNTVRDVSLTYRGEVRLRKLQGEDYERFNPDVLAEFRKRLRDAIHRLSHLPQNHIAPQLYEGDCRQLPFADKHFNLVITSPPYGDIKNTIPYHQFSKNMLFWLGLGEAAINQIRDHSLGAKNSHKSIPESETLDFAISRMNKANLIHEAIRFYADYDNALHEIARVTADRIIIVIGHRILDGVLIDNPAITTELMRLHGWKLETRFQRTIRKKRISRKMGFGNNAQGGTIDSEAILVYVPIRP